jgi:hypothetical protein
MPLLVHIAPGNEANSISRSGIAARRIPGADLPFARVVWAFPVLPSYTLTHSWSREIKRWRTTTLAAITFRVPDDEPVLASHYSRQAQPMTAAQAVGLILAAEDPRGYEIMLSRRIARQEIVRVRPLPKAVGWRYYPDAKNQPAKMCDCPMCLPIGEVKARRFRERVKSRMRASGLPVESDRQEETPA